MAVKASDTPAEAPGCRAQAVRCCFSCEDGGEGGERAEGEWGAWVSRQSEPRGPGPGTSQSHAGPGPGTAVPTVCGRVVSEPHEQILQKTTACTKTTVTVTGLSAPQSGSSRARCSFLPGELAVPVTPTSQVRKPKLGEEDGDLVCEHRATISELLSAVKINGKATGTRFVFALPRNQQPEMTGWSVTDMLCAEGRNRSVCDRLAGKWTALLDP
ncbi:hypothetical protein TREES_T100014312 [Tupaia chinensis]|uniref:Uncharacterized protein n=1 Tax=Tupaia chinensis TaxID=246437 RepID=L9JET0_TUPCH|nr:hypothetical protein TREES_T100014312 [Tupaia chinensis]